MGFKRRYVRWDRLDNTAHLFPVIAGESMTNTYRLSAVLRDDVDQSLLQQALDILLPKFDLFNVRLRVGFFWYYFEENNKKAPRVAEESTYPCRYISPSKNQSYLFRVTYYRNRINLEVFHVLTDGMGGVNFMKELVSQYLRLAYPDILGDLPDELMESTSLNREDDFLSNYDKPKKNNYEKKRAYTIKGEHLPDDGFGVIRGTVSLSELKKAVKGYNVSVNDYLVGAFAYGIYRGSLKGHHTDKAIRVAVPVNLRPFFDSYTTKNFFAMISADFLPETGRTYSFEEVLAITTKSIRSQLTKENLSDILSYNVSNQKNIFARAVPIWLKNLAIRAVYSKSALANTTTLTNVGAAEFPEEYSAFVKDFFGFLSMSKGQLLKATVFSFKDNLNITFSTVYKDTAVERCFFGVLSSDGLKVEVETNGVFE